MSRRPLPRRAAGLAGAVVLALGLLTGCAGTREYAATPLPTTPAPAASTAPAATPAQCADLLNSYDPRPVTSSSEVLTRIRQRQRLVVGVSADTLLFGARDARSGAIVGFDIDLARALAASLLGSPDKIELKVITAAQRLPFLKDGTVDVVARTMSITCDRWKEIAFSAEYFEAGQRILVAERSPVKDVAGLAGKRVCAPAGSTSLDTLRRVAPQAVPVPADTHTRCLILFQQSKVDAITGDDTVLAGLASQDPYTRLVGPKFSREPYGLGLPPGDPTFVGAVNTALASWVSSGGWTASYRTWLAADLGPGVTAPTPRYGRR
ncbi:MAG: glutamate ABC transporter substrate-binding protein [Kineosporiaceae bacterium]